MRTLIRIALYTPPDGPPTAKQHIEFRGTLSESEAVTRARHIIRANDRLDHPERGYLLNCLYIGNYEITTEPGST